MKNTTSIGNQSETLACHYIVDKGYTIVQRNYKYRFCEIDIVARNNTTIVFVEVKYRRRRDFGGAIGAITPNKVKRIQYSAEFWLSQHQEFARLQPRLDVITVVGDISMPEVTHLENIM